MGSAGSPGTQGSSILTVVHGVAVGTGAGDHGQAFAGKRQAREGQSQEQGSGKTWLTQLFIPIFHR